MNQEKTKELKILARKYFEIAASHVYQSSDLNEQLRKSIEGMKLVSEAELPGYENKNIKFGKFENREFVVMMIDIRKSTEIINGPNGLVNMFLIFYVYAGIVAKIVDECKGTATEYLGDGVLSLFDTIDASRDQALMSAMQAAWNILEARETILNPLFKEVGLPEINFGIGIDHGLTIVTKFGYRGDTDLKAFGKCAYNASKLSKGNNKCHVSENSKQVWPKTNDGKLTFGSAMIINGEYAFQALKADNL